MAKIGTEFTLDTSALDSLVNITCNAKCKNNGIYQVTSNTGGKRGFFCNLKRSHIGEGGQCQNFKPFEE